MVRKRNKFTAILIENLHVTIIDYMERMQGFLAQQYDVNPAQGQAGEEQGGKGQQARSNFKPSTVQFDNGEYFRVDNNFQEKEVLYARSVSFFIEFQCAASQAEYHRKKRDLIDGGTKVDEEIKKFVQNWMLLRSFSQSKETDMKVPWLGSLKKEWTDHTAWVGLKDPCGQNKLKFFQNMQVSDHFGDYDFRIAGEQIFLYIGEAVLETFDQKETNFEAGMKWIVGDFTTINIKEVLFEGVVDATAAGTDDHHDEFDRFGKSIREKTEDERIVAEAYEAQVHKAFLLLLMYGIHFRRVKNMTLLEPRAIERARVLMYDRLQGSKALLDAVCKEYWELAKTNPGEEFTLGRGMLFHGPPG